MTFKQGSINDQTQHNRPKPMEGAPSFIKNVSGMTPGEYALDSYQPGVAGEVTVLPRVSHEGGIKDSENPYGTVVMGKAYHGAGEDLTIQDIAHRMPTGKPRAGIDQKNDYEENSEEEINDSEVLAVIDPDTLSTQPEVEESPKGPQEYVSPRQAQSDIDYLQAVVQGTPHVPKPAPAAVPVQQELLSFERKRIRVRISGSKFGNYKGHYLHVVDGPDYLILFYDMDDAGYEPPYTDRGDPITVRCEDKEHKVYYMGMDFDLKINNLGMQIYIKHKE